MRGITRGYIDSGQGQVHFRHAGQGLRPLILLHQSPLSGTQFDAVMPELVAAGFQPLALDMPGFGMSDAPPDGATLQDYAAIIPAALSHFGWPACPIVGHHTGAVVAALYAAEHAERVPALVLNGFPVLTQAERDHFATFYFGPKDPKPDGSHLITAWENRLRSSPGWSDLRLMHRYTVEALYRGESNWRAFPLIMNADLAATLQALRVPTLMFTNTGEDLYDSTRRAFALRPEFFDYAELPGGNHDIVDQQPQAWTQVVADFLDKRLAGELR